MSFSAFVAFPGQGSQHISMLSKGGISDIAKSKEYSSAIEFCSELISNDVLKLIEEGPEDLINQTSITQPVLLLCSYLHFERLKNLINFNPEYLAGHSLGEYSALVAADSISIFNALLLVRKRGELMEIAQKGSMCAIMGLDKEVISKICEDVSVDETSHVQCANLNSPSQTVISGHEDAVTKAIDLCSLKGAKRSIILKVSIASHSRLMLKISKEFDEFLNNIDFQIPKIKILHNVSVKPSESIEDLRSLLVSQLYSPVRWSEICGEIKRLNLPIIECGPGKVLGGLFKANKLDNYFSTSEEDFYEKIINHER